MNIHSFRRYLQSPAEVRLPFAVAAFLGLLWIGFLLALALRSEPGGQYALAPIFAAAAVLATFAALRSAGVVIQRTLPSARTAACAAVALVAFLLAGASLLVPLVDYTMTNSLDHGRASFTSLHVSLEDEEQPGNAALWKARSIDWAVEHWAKSDRESESSWMTAMVRSLPFVARSRENDRKALTSFAENRLKRLAGDAPLWAVTSRLCEEQALREGKRYPMDYRPQFERIAASYTRLLGREVTAANLMPRLPGGRCD